MCSRLMLAIAIASSFPVVSGAEDKLPAVLTDKPIVAGDEADPLRKLLVARYNAALTEVQKRYHAAFNVSKATLDIEGLGRAAERLLRAGVELSSAPDERVKVHERHVELARHLEKLAEAADRAGVSKNATDVEVARYYRSDAEIGLLRAKEEANPPKKK
jgi:hypothetical protein